MMIFLKIKFIITKKLFNLVRLGLILSTNNYLNLIIV